MKVKVLAVCLVFCVLFSGCANDTPDFTLSGTQTVHGIEYPPLKGNATELSYIYGKCTSCSVSAITDDMFTVYATISYDSEKYDVRIGIGEGRTNSVSTDKIKGKTIVAYGSLSETESQSHSNRIFSPLYIELDGEIYSSSEFMDYLTA